MKTRLKGCVSYIYNEIPETLSIYTSIKKKLESY